MIDFDFNTKETAVSHLALHHAEIYHKAKLQYKI